MTPKKAHARARRTIDRRCTCRILLRVLPKSNSAAVIAAASNLRVKAEGGGGGGGKSQKQRKIIAVSVRNRWVTDRAMAASRSDDWVASAIGCKGRKANVAKCVSLESA